MVPTRRLIWGVGSLAIILLGLWLLDHGGGASGRASLRQTRATLAADKLARDGVARLAAPLLDPRGGAKRRVWIHLERRADSSCFTSVSAAVQGHPAFRLIGPKQAVPTGDHPRLAVSCRDRSVVGSSLFRVELELRLSGLPAGWKGPTSFKGQQQVVGYLALAPPLVAVVGALAFGRILLSMLLAIFCAAIISLLGQPEKLADPLWQRLLMLPLDLLQAAWHALYHFLLGPLMAEFKWQVMAFATSLVGMIAVITRAGGTHGLLALFGRLRGNPVTARLSVWLMGMVLFFDDCANTLVVGSAARPLTDEAKVSREKLAYLVDSTAAPVAGVALISTWIGFEVGLFQTTAESMGLGKSGFELFIDALPMRFYCLFALFFGLMGILLRRDFGPMLRAERRAHAGQVSAVRPGGGSPDAFLEGGGPPAGLPPSWPVAVLPLALVLFGVLGGILVAGHHTAGVQLALDRELYQLGSIAHLRDCFTQAGRAGLQGWAMFFAGLAGSALALILARRRRRQLPPEGQTDDGGALTWRDLGKRWLMGGRAIGGAIGILVCAWAIQQACDVLGTSVTLTAALSGVVSPAWLPLLIFLTAAAIAFATGTSWGTMGILIPAVLPLAHALGGADNPLILVLAAGAVLDGAIFGDHCSPISDTTVMSSLSSGCHHLDHIRTQLPYAMTVMVVAAGAGYLLRAQGVALWVCYGLAAVILVGVLLVLGRSPDSSPT